MIFELFSKKLNTERSAAPDFGYIHTLENAAAGPRTSAPARSTRKEAVLRKAWQIFVRDLKRLAKNPVAIVVTIGVAIIPSLYAWFNILANWDPYENTSTVPIAVVVKDKGAEVGDMGQINAGDMIREKLEENTQLGWQFVDSEDDAVEGVRAGTYYAAFIVPEDFTSSLADVLDGNTDKAHIAYYVNEKANAVAPKVTDTGSTTIENQIANEFVDVVGKTVTEKLTEFAGDAADSIDGARDTVAADLTDASAKLGELADGIDGAQGTISSARATVSTARDSLSTVSAKASGLGGGLSGALDDLAGTRSKATALAARLNSALASANGTVSGISSQANYNVGVLAGDVGWAQGQLDAAIAQVRSLDGATTSIQASLEKVRTYTLSIAGNEYATQLSTKVEADLEVVTELSDAQKEALDKLQAVSDKLKGATEDVTGLSADVNDAIQGTTSALSDLQTSLAQTTMPQLNEALDGFSNTGGKLVGTASSLPALLSQADGTLGELDAILEQCSTTLSSTAGSVRTGAEKVSGIASDVAAVESAENFEGIKDVLGLDAEGVGDFLGSPAQLVNMSVYPVENYGSGVAPFYTNLALWVGGFVLVAIYKLEVDREEIGDYKPWQGFFGRWLLLNLIGQVQAVICCVGDICLGIQCLNPAAFVFAGMVESFVYVFFIYALSIAFKHIGKALGVLLVVLQIPGASGTYPIEMQPDFFRALNPWLPFTYGINAMREAIAGFYGNYYAHNLLVLLVYLVPALLIGVTARRHLLNINNLFDRKLGETDMMVTERTGMKSHFRLATLVKAIMDSENYRDTFLATAASFELKYPVLVRRGFAALVAVPLVLLALMFATEAKFAMLVLWILSLVIICTFLIVVEYLHNRVGEKTQLSNMDQDELYGMLDDELKEELLAFAPIEKMRLERGRTMRLDSEKGGDE